MPLIQTIQLIKKYGPQILDGTIGDEELELFLQRPEHDKDIIFKNSPTSSSLRRDTLSNLIRESHDVTRSGGIIDFVVTIGARLSEQQLHTLVKRCLNLSYENLFHCVSLMEGKFEHILLAYEMHHYPKNAEKHFQKGRMEKKFFHVSPVESKILKTESLAHTQKVFEKMIDFYLTREHLIEMNQTLAINVLQEFSTFLPNYIKIEN